MDVIEKDGIPYVTLDYVIKQSGWSKRKNFVKAIKTQSLPFTVIVMKAPKALHIVNKYWVPQNEAEEFIPRYKKENAERLAAAEAERQAKEAKRDEKRKKAKLKDNGITEVIDGVQYVGTAYLNKNIIWLTSKQIENKLYKDSFPFHPTRFNSRMHFKKAEVDEYIKQYSYTTPSGKVYVDKAIRHRNQYMQNFVSFVRRTGDAAKELEQICRFYDFFIVNSTSVQDICRFIGRVSDDDQEGSFVNAIQVAKMYDAAILVTSFRNVPFSIRSAVQGHAIDFKVMSLASNERGLGIVWASEFYKYD